MLVAKKVGWLISLSKTNLPRFFCSSARIERGAIAFSITCRPYLDRYFDLLIIAVMILGHRLTVYFCRSKIYIQCGSKRALFGAV